MAFMIKTSLQMLAVLPSAIVESLALTAAETSPAELFDGFDVLDNNVKIATAEKALFTHLPELE